MRICRLIAACVLASQIGAVVVLSIGIVQDITISKDGDILTIQRQSVCDGEGQWRLDRTTGTYRYEPRQIQWQPVSAVASDR